MDDPFEGTDDVTVIMETLLDIRGDLAYVIWLLEDDGAQAEEDS